MKTFSMGRNKGIIIYQTARYAKARLFLLVDLQDFFSDLGSGDEKKKNKSFENDQLTGHFQTLFFLRAFFEYLQKNQ